MILNSLWKCFEWKVLEIQITNFKIGQEVPIKKEKELERDGRFLLKLRIRQHWYPLGIIRKKVLNKNPPNDLH